MLLEYYQMFAYNGVNKRKRGVIMERIEVPPLPEACLNCKEEECYNCDVAGQRWILSPESKLLLRRAAVCRAIDRLSRELEEIDQALEELAGTTPAAHA